MKLINIGFGNLVAAERLVAVVGPDSAPARRTVQESRAQGMLIDATFGRRARAVLVADSGHVILAAIPPETIAARATDLPDPDPPPEDDAEG